jgi:hypothetical protein
MYVKNKCAAKNSDSSNSQVNTKVFEHSKACTDEESFAENEVAIPDSCGNLEGYVLGE